MNNNNNNILRVLEPKLIKYGNTSYTSLDMCIKEKKIFGILFISGIIPTIDKIIQLFNNLLNSFKQNEEILQLIICICDEGKNEYDISLSKLTDLSCFIIPFESEEKEQLINKYNIISLPCLIIFDKDGKVLDYLNNSDINNITIEKIKGWKNSFNIVNNYSNYTNYNKITKYYIGDEGFVTGHQHVLVYTDYLGKSPSYGKGNWYCDICGKTNKYDVTNFYCDICGYDVCDNCYEKNKKFY